MFIESGVGPHLRESESILPRRYQEEIFSRAQKGNVIAAMDTGSGKTLISLLLIRWISSQEKSRGKVIIFLVPKIALVEQQHAYIENNTSLRVLKLHGAQELDLSDRIGWRNRFKSCDVVVMTAQIFANVLTHSLWSTDRVSLMIFDECHHARKNHPYNGILREYFHVPAHLRPKVFGMTASPIWNTKDPLGSLATLEKNLDAKVTAVRDHVEELVSHSPKAEELIKVYPHPPEEYDFPSPTIYECLQVIDAPVWDHLDIAWSSIRLRYAVTLNNVGPYCASLFLYQEIKHHITKIIAENNRNVTDGLDDVMEGILPYSKPSSQTLPDELFLIIDILVDFQSVFPVEAAHSSIPVPVSLDWCTPKVKVLVDVLVEYHTRTPAFQCIIFVEQRQVASSLSNVLQATPELQGKIKCAFLTGQGVNSEGLSKQTDRYDGDPVKLFRDHEINILIATSVAEEGLDFKQCDLVVRFDPLHHMVGYVQSRGRARKHGSTFVVMVEQNDTVRLLKYQALREKEPEVNHIYQTRHMKIELEEELDSDDETDPADMMARERYVVESTGAVLTYDNSLSLLNHLCSLIPRDAFTTAHVPVYTGDFEATVQLPRALPLSSQDLVFSGAVRRSKKEARRAAAFKAVKRLRDLDVFDEYLLPMAKMDDYVGSRKKLRQGKTRQDKVPVIMTVSVRDPWCIGHKLWLHPVVVDSQAIAGLVTGTPISPEEAVIGGRKVTTLPPSQLCFEEDLEHEQRAAMHQYTRLGIWHNITSSPISAPLSLYLVPITSDCVPDFKAIELLLENPRGHRDWSQISEDHYDELLVLTSNYGGRTYLLRRIRHDLTPLSTPPPGSRESNVGTTYHDYWMQKWSRRNRQAIVPFDGPLLETSLLPRTNVGSYSLEDNSDQSLPVHSVLDNQLLPRNACTWLPMSLTMRRAFLALPVLCHRITNAYRERSARHELGLPAIPKNLVIEAFTTPSASMPFNNQRLETLGDAVLQLCTTVHLLNKYPNRHEGQLSSMRQGFVANQYLLRRARDLGFDRFVNSETPSVYKWRYVVSDVDGELPPKRSVTREYPRRSLQDCMEAILGASFVAGGIDLALQTGTALGLEFGGPLPWFIRYGQNVGPTLIASLFLGLEKNLGYKFRYNHLILESLSHPSFTNSEVPSYQRLEFLGDAILDLVVINYLYRKYPEATSHQLALPRTKAICAPSLASIAVRRLGLQKMMLVNNVDLSIAIDRYTPLLERVSGAEIVKTGWKFDPPKAISDVFESIIGAVLVDSGYNYEKTAAVVEDVMSEVLEVLSPGVDKDPVSELLEWIAGCGCRSVSFEKKMKTVDAMEQEGIAVIVHGTVISGPIVSASLTVAKFAAAERALAILVDATSEKALSKLCDCAMAMEVIAADDQLNQSSGSEDAAEVADILTRIGYVDWL